MLDRFIFGNVHRISPEAPVPVVRSIEEKYSLGGCGNVLRNLDKPRSSGFYYKFCRKRSSW